MCRSASLFHPRRSPRSGGPSPEKLHVYDSELPANRVHLVCRRIGYDGSSDGDSMLNNIRADLEPAWVVHLWYGSAFGCWCLVGAAGVVLSFMKLGTFRFFVGACYLAVFVLALHSFFIAMRANPPAKKLSLRIGFLACLCCLPWVVRLFIK